MSLAGASRSELKKQFSTSMWWVLALVLLAYVGFTAAGLAAAFGASASGSLPGSGPAMPEDMLPPLIYTLATSVGYVFPVLVGTLLVTGEFRHKTLTPTFLATPRRGIALGAKILAGVAVGAVYAVIGVVAAVGPGAGVLSLFGVPTRLDDGDVLAIIGRMLVASVLWALVGVGIGTLVRNQVAAVVGVIAFTQFLEPILRMIGGFVGAIEPVTRFLPGASSDALVGASLYSALAAPGAAPLPWWAGGLVLLAYAAVTIVVGFLVSWRRDVT